MCVNKMFTGDEPEKVKKSIVGDIDSYELLLTRKINRAWPSLRRESERDPSTCYMGRDAERHPS
jgi:hypothetical protein